MKWSIIRVGIITMFMGMTTIVFGMTDDDREQRRAERHQRKLEQYKSGWNRLIPKYQNVQYAGSMGLLSLANYNCPGQIVITGEKNSGKRRSCSAWFLVFPPTRQK